MNSTRLSHRRLALPVLIVAAAALAALVFGHRACRNSQGGNQRGSVTDSAVIRIQDRGRLLVGTTGDYRPLSFLTSDGRYEGFDIEMAEAIATHLGVEAEFVPTSWPSLTADVMAEPQKFDLAIGGITITEQRCRLMVMSEGYLANGKTILCRTDDAGRFLSLDDIDRPDVRVMVNPGGTNEQFAKDRLRHAVVVVHPSNEEIPGLIAEGAADVMVTEITEAPWYTDSDSRLAAPLIDKPFTGGQIGVLMCKGQEDLLQAVNALIRQMKSDSTLFRLHEKYGLSYSF